MRIAPISTAGYAKKRWAIMASKTSQPIPLEDVVRAIERRRAETGITELPRNSGLRRTASKRALLKAIEEAGGKW